MKGSSHWDHSLWEVPWNEEFTRGDKLHGLFLCRIHTLGLKHLTMSCPNGGSVGIYRLLSRKRCFFDQGIFKGRDYWHPWSRWTGPIINLSLCAPKRKERKTKIEPRIKLNHNIYKQMQHITVLCLLKLKLIFKQRVYFLLQVYICFRFLFL